MCLYVPTTQLFRALFRAICYLSSHDNGVYQASEGPSPAAILVDSIVCAAVMYTLYLSGIFEGDGGRVLMEGVGEKLVAQCL